MRARRPAFLAWLSLASLAGAGSLEPGRLVKDRHSDNIDKWMKEGIPMSEVEKHNHWESAWILVRDRVYDCTLYLQDHPAGASPILSMAGGESTKDFEDVHSQRASRMLADYFIGPLRKQDAAADEKAANESSPTLIPLSALPLRTKGREVVNAQGEVVSLYCVNWYGAHMEQMANNGLGSKSLDNLTSMISEMHFNCVRLPFSLDLVFGPPSRVPSEKEALAANPSPMGLSPLQVLDATVEALTRRGLLVMLNVHSSTGMWCCSENDGDGLWYTKAYPEFKWLDAVEIMASRYKGNARVAGFDLRNELRRSDLGQPTWSSGDSSTDWADAAAKAGLKVAGTNDNMLIIVSGLHFSMFLCDVPQRPIHLEPQLWSRVVYTAHEYDWYFSDLGVYHRIACRLAALYATLPCLVVLYAAASVAAPAHLGAWGGRSPARSLRWKTCAPWSCARLRKGHLLDGLAAPPGVALVAFWLACSAAFHALLGAGETAASGCLRRGLDSKWLLPLVASGLVGALCSVRIAARVARWLQDALAPPKIQREITPDVLGANLSPLVEEDEQQLSFSQPKKFTPKGSSSQTLQPCSPDENRAEGARGIRAFAPVRRALCPSRTALLAFLLPVVVTDIAVVGWGLASYEAFERELDIRWGFLMREGGGEASTAPVWLGEFGTDVDSTWWRYMLRFIRTRRVSFAYWPFNGDKRPPWSDADEEDKDETFGLVTMDYSSVRHEWKLAALQDLMAASSTEPV